jgi:heat-inducible transcriptional repressor
MDLTERQIQILKSIIEEFTETTNKGFLKQPHTSAGRTPSPMAIKFYVNELMAEKELSVSEEVAVKGRVWDYRFELENLLREATRCLSEKTGAISVATMDDKNIYHAGYANILDMPEFFDIDVTRSVLSLLDETQTLLGIFKKAVGEKPIHVLVGEELGHRYFEPVGMVFTRFSGGKRSGSLGVIGPSRLNYPYVIPMVRYFGNLINDIAKDWE